MAADVDRRYVSFFLLLFLYFNDNAYGLQVLHLVTTCWCQHGWRTKDRVRAQANRGNDMDWDGEFFNNFLLWLLLTMFYMFFRHYFVMWQKRHAQEHKQWFILLFGPNCAHYGCHSPQQQEWVPAPTQKGQEGAYIDSDSIYITSMKIVIFLFEYLK